MQTEISTDDEGNQEEKHKYIREYSCLSLVMFGCGNTIGAGIFAYTGLAAEYAGGSGAYIAYIMAGIVSFLTALVYAEFGAKYPKSGSSYLYSSIF
jgi:amino acid transporter